jgi:hypothetical protein
LVVGLSSWNGGTGWCGAAIFFDFYLNAVYPMILVTLCVILYTRQHTTDSLSIHLVAFLIDLNPIFFSASDDHNHRLNMELDI